MQPVGISQWILKVCLSPTCPSISCAPINIYVKLNYGFVNVHVFCLFAYSKFNFIIFLRQISSKMLLVGKLLKPSKQWDGSDSTYLRYCFSPWGEVMYSSHKWCYICTRHNCNQNMLYIYWYLLINQFCFHSTSNIYSYTRHMFG